MKISILSQDLSKNCLGRAYLLAKILQRRYDVEIVGPIFGEGIWEPVAGDKSIEYKSLKMGAWPKPYYQLPRLAHQIEGDIIYASKPHYASFGLGLMAKKHKDRPLVLDIDDWEMGFVYHLLGRKNIIKTLAYLCLSPIEFYKDESYLNTFIYENAYKKADAITVSNEFLKDKFGGTVIYHGRDTKVFDPGRFNKDALLDRYGLAKDKKIVMFLGTPRPHKGIETLLEAMTIIKDGDVILVIVGIDYKDGYCQKILRIAANCLGARFRGYGLQPFEKIPEFLAVADVVVIPQMDSKATKGQIPAKLFDAMAMAKPIIASYVNDIPDILKDCGWLIEAQSPQKLAETIELILSNLEESMVTAMRARKKCTEKYSWDALEKVLIPIFQKLSL